MTGLLIGNDKLNVMRCFIVAENIRDNYKKKEGDPTADL